jgi:hypothetical protein
MKVQKETDSPCAVWQPLLVLCFLLAMAVVLVACGSSVTTGSETPSLMGTLNVTLSDPATCMAPGGPFSHVYVTIKDVQANMSSTAGDNDSGWVDLTPNLASAPKQVDLLGQANNQCFLATLGDNEQLQSGSYHQIRVILADNSLSISHNACGSSANCVVLAADSSVHELQLSSESKTGLKIPSGQIASGGFTILPGKTEDLNIDFNTCSSILQEGNGQYRLKPVLHAGAVSTTSSSINGKVLDHATGNPVSGSVLVALEQTDAFGVDRVIMSTTAGADGTFVFCPLPAGTYDVVVVGTRTDGAFYEPSIVTGVAVGDTTGGISLYLPSNPAASGANLSGLVTSQTGAKVGTAADIQLSALETVGSIIYTIPLAPTSTQSNPTLAVATAPSGSGMSCPAGTDCASYTMQIASGGPYVGAWSAGGATLTQSAPLAAYVVEGIATVPGSGGALDCSPSELQSTPPPLTGSGPYSVTVPTLAFVSCQ